MTGITRLRDVATLKDMVTIWTEVVLMTVVLVPGGVNSVLEHNYWRKVASDTGVVLNVVKPSCHIHELLLLLHG